MFSVGQLQADTIGRPGLLGFCIFGKRQKRDVCGVVTTRFLAKGGSAHVALISFTVDFTFR